MMAYSCRYDPKKYKRKKEAIPLASVQSVHMSRKDDCYVIIKVKTEHGHPCTHF